MRNTTWRKYDRTSLTVVILAIRAWQRTHPRSIILPGIYSFDLQLKHVSLFRAYSFGGRTAHVKTVSTAMADSVIDSGSSLDSKPAEPVCSTSTNNNQDDPRKRAFSLGNKGLLTELRKPFRKISQHATRNRQSHASASHSGGSLGSSAASFGPTSTSSNQLSTSNEQGEYVRNR